MFKSLSKISVPIIDWQEDGFQKVTDVKFYHSFKESELLCNYNYEFTFSNVNKGLMFGSHNSWVYCVVLNGFIIKIGETGLRLGKRYSDAYQMKGSYYENNPTGGSKSRFGRLKESHPGYGGCEDTDFKIRRLLHESKSRKTDQITLWAKQCAKTETKILIGGRLQSALQTTHKFEELAYLDCFREATGQYPALNGGRK